MYHNLNSILLSCILQEIDSLTPSMAMLVLNNLKTKASLIRAEFIFVLLHNVETSEL